MAYTSPTISAACLPASIAALTADTSPVTTTFTSHEPIFTVPTNFTSAALVIASVASIAPVRLLVSSNPIACIGNLPL